VVPRRSGAYAINATLTALVLVGTVLITGGVRARKDGCPDPIPRGHACLGIGSTGYVMRSSVFVWFSLALVGLFMVTVVVPQVVVHSSLGKALLDVRVVRQKGDRPGFLRSSVRVLALVVDLMPLLLPIGLWLVLVTPGHRRIGDYLAGTFVVRRAALGQPVVVPARRAWFRRR
jgi:uncharacterized RDD family membrane protein YckC